MTRTLGPTTVVVDPWVVGWTLGWLAWRLGSSEQIWLAQTIEVVSLRIALGLRPVRF